MVGRRPASYVLWLTARYASATRVRHGICAYKFAQTTQVVEGITCTCATFADSENLITGSDDHIVRLWRFSRNNSGSSGLSISLSNMMRVHRDTILCVAASRSWSVIVSGSKDGSAVLWDLNRAVYMRSIWHGEGDAVGVHLVAINESTVRTAVLSF